VLSDFSKFGGSAFRSIWQPQVPPLVLNKYGSPQTLRGHEIFPGSSGVSRSKTSTAKRSLVGSPGSHYVHNVKNSGADLVLRIERHYHRHSLFAFGAACDVPVGCIAMVSNAIDHAGQQFDTGSREDGLQILHGLARAFKAFSASRRQ
jgi:hypothetical protein